MGSSAVFDFLRVATALGLACGLSDRGCVDRFCNGFGFGVQLAYLGSDDFGGGGFKCMATLETNT